MDLSSTPPSSDDSVLHLTDKALVPWHSSDSSSQNHLNTSSFELECEELTRKIRNFPKELRAIEELAKHPLIIDFEDKEKDIDPKDTSSDDNQMEKFVTLWDINIQKSYPSQYFPITDDNILGQKDMFTILTSSKDYFDWKVSFDGLFDDVDKALEAEEVKPNFDKVSTTGTHTTWVTASEHVHEKIDIKPENVEEKKKGKKREEEWEVLEVLEEEDIQEVNEGSIDSIQDETIMNQFLEDSLLFRGVYDESQDSMLFEGVYDENEDDENVWECFDIIDAMIDNNANE